MGFQAGKAWLGRDNIGIGNLGTLLDEEAIRIGTARTQRLATIAGSSGVTVASGVNVVIDTNGQLGTITPPRAIRKQLKAMAKSSEALLKLEPVTFRHKERLRLVRYSTARPGRAGSSDGVTTYCD